MLQFRHAVDTLPQAALRHGQPLCVVCVARSMRCGCFLCCVVALLLCTPPLLPLLILLLLALPL